MKSFIGTGIGRIILLGFDRGDLLLESIREELSRLGIANAVLLSAVGTLSHAECHRVATLDELPKNEYFSVSQPIELSSIEGMVVNGEPHFHVTFADLEKSYAAHLEDGCVVEYLAEVVLGEMLGVESLARVPNENGVRLLSSGK